MRYGPETPGPPHLVVGWQLPIPFVTCPAIQVLASGFGQAGKLMRAVYPGVKQAGPAIVENRAPGEASVAVRACRVWLKH
jgi:hypothetical protein